VLNRTCLPSDFIAFVVFCRLRYRLTLRDLSKILLLRGFTVSHETVREWEQSCCPSWETRCVSGVTAHGAGPARAGTSRRRT
jgi:transposase-like protein